MWCAGTKLASQSLQPQAHHHEGLDGVVVHVGRDLGPLAVLCLHQPVEVGPAFGHQRPEVGDVLEDDGDPLRGGIDPEGEPRVHGLVVLLELDGFLGRQRLLVAGVDGCPHRTRERLPHVLADEGDALASHQLLRGRVDEPDLPVAVESEDPVADAVERCDQVDPRGGFGGDPCRIAVAHVRSPSRRWRRASRTQRMRPVAHLRRRYPITHADVSSRRQL